MPEENGAGTTVMEGTAQEGQGNQQGTSLGWRAGLPDEYKNHEAFTGFKTVGELAKSHLETSAKAKELETSLGEMIPKLPDDATQEERDVYYESLGRPEKFEDYEFEGEDKNAPEWTNGWKQDLFNLGVSKDTAKSLSGLMNSRIQAMVESHNAQIQKEISTASDKLKTEWGEKYDTNLELVKRGWKRDADSEFDQAFSGETSANRFAILRTLFKLYSKTGEDSSQPGSSQRQQSLNDTRGFYSDMPAKR